MEVDNDEAITPTLTDDKIIQAVIEEKHGKETEADSEEEDDPEPRVTWKDAAEGLATFIKFVEQCTYMGTHDVMSLHCLQNEFIMQRGKHSKQRDIRNFMKINKDK